MPLALSGDGSVGPLSATEVGYLDGVTSAVQTQIDAKLNLAGGKILQIVRDTDTSVRNSTSTTFTDVTGVSVTITPQKSTSVILVIATYFAYVNATATGHRGRFQITDASNNALSGAEDQYWGSANSQQQVQGAQTLIGYSTPGVTSAVTYKLRFCTTNAASAVETVGSITSTQLYAIEVSA